MIAVALFALVAAQSPADPQLARHVAEMNAERARCRARPLAVDPRLQAIARERLAQMATDGYGHGDNPLPALMAKHGFPGTREDVSEGAVLGGYENAGISYLHFGPNNPAGIKARGRTKHEPMCRDPRGQWMNMDHHNDLIDPRWNIVGHAWGVPGGKCPNAASVTVYGRLPLTVAVPKGIPPAVAPRGVAKMREETWEPAEIIVSSGRFVGGLVVKSLASAGHPQQLVMLFDPETGRTGDGGTTITVDGRSVDRYELLRWFSKTRIPGVVLVHDDDRYGHVVEARFYSQ